MKNKLNETSVTKSAPAAIITPALAGFLDLVHLADHPGDAVVYRHFRMTPLAAAKYPDGVPAAEELSLTMAKSLTTHGLVRTLRELRAWLPADPAVAWSEFTESCFADLLRAAAEFERMRGPGDQLSDFARYLGAHAAATKRQGVHPGGTVFVVAMRREADAVRPHLRPGDRLIVCGIGKVNAAAATQRAICEGAAAIWNVGVAGGFGREMKVGDCVVVDRAVEYDFDLSEVNGTAIGILDGRDTPYFPCAADFAPQLPRATLASGDRFGDRYEADDSATLAVLGATVRDMEGAAVAHVCEANGVPCRIMKAISDVRGDGSMVGQYEASIGAALAALSAAVRDALATCP